MRWATWLVVLAAVGTVRADDPPEPPDPPVAKTELRLQLDLVDGSRLLAKPVEPDQTLSLRTDVGTIVVPLAKLQRVELDADGETTRFFWPNEDRLTGFVEEGKLEVETVLGRLEIPFASIRTCTMQIVDEKVSLKPVGVRTSGAYAHQTPAQAIDGSLGSSWSSGGYSGWIEVDLGAPFELSRISFHLQFGPGPGPATYDVYVSNEPFAGDRSGNPRLERFSGTHDDHDTLTVDCEPNTFGRFVHVHCPSSSVWFNVREFEVYPRVADASATRRS